MALNIVSPGPLTTVQDFGRHGHQAEAIPSAAHAINTRWRWRICSAATATVRMSRGLSIRFAGRPSARRIIRSSR